MDWEALILILCWINSYWFKCLNHHFSTMTIFVNIDTFCRNLQNNVHIRKSIKNKYNIVGREYTQWTHIWKYEIIIFNYL